MGKGKSPKGAAAPPPPPPPPPPTNIFQMEFNVEALQMWQLPDDGECLASDPNRIDFHYSDLVHVAIEHDDSRIAIGKNCLFTLAGQPTPEDGPVKIEVFKLLPECREIPDNIVKIGSGELDVQQTFDKIFGQIADIEAQAEEVQPEHDYPISDVFKAWYPLTAIVMVEAPIEEGEEEGEEEGGAMAPLPPPPRPITPTGPNSQIEFIGGQQQSKQEELGEEEDLPLPPEIPMVETIVNVGMVCVRLRITCFGTTIVLPSVQPMRPRKKRQVQTDPMECPMVCCPQLLTPVCGQAAKTTQSRRSVGVKQETKPEKTATGMQTPSGSCVGSSGMHSYAATAGAAADSKHINEDTLDQKDTPWLVKTEPKTERDGTPAAPKSSKTDQVVQHEGDEPVDPDEGFEEVVAEKKRPTAFDEYFTQFEENILIVRVAKNTRKVVRMVPDNGEGDVEGDVPPEEPPCPPSEESYKKPMPVVKGPMPGSAQQQALEDYHNPKREPEGPSRYKMMCEQEGFNLNFHIPYDTLPKYVNTCGLPVIRGNRKYPAGFDTVYRLPDLRQPGGGADCKTEDGTAFEMVEHDVATQTQRVADGVEVYKRPTDDANYDVFVLQLSPQESSAEDYVELEVHTPRSPAVVVPVQTIDTETVETEFAFAYNKDGSKLGKGKGGKGKGKGKGKDKKGKGGDDEGGKGGKGKGKKKK